jgi:isoamylase/glycogen operon protein
MGDEYVHTRFGNNNPWCQDNDTNWFLWDERLQSKEIFNFFQQVIAFRKSSPLLRRETFFSDKEIEWHGTHPFKPGWDSDSRMLACTIKDLVNHNNLYIAFSSYFVPIDITLPHAPQGFAWYRICDTSLSPPLDFCSNPKMQMKMNQNYQMAERSCVVCIARPENF